MRNSTQKALSFYLVCPEPTTNVLHIGLVKNGQVEQQWLTGSNFPYSQRPIDHQQFLFPFELAPGESASLIAGAQHRSVQNILRVEEQSSYWRRMLYAELGNGIYLGSAGLLSLFILFMTLINGKSEFWFFYGCVLSSVAHNLVTGGYLDKYLLANIGGISGPTAIITTNITYLFYVLFTISFLEFLLRNKKWLVALGRLYIFFNIATSVMIIFSPAFLKVPMLLSSVGLALVLLICMWIYSLFGAFTGHMRSRYFAIAALFYLVPMLIGSYFAYYLSIHEVPWWAKVKSYEVAIAIGFYIALLNELRKSRLQETFALQQAEAKTNFFATMSHELRTPLNGVIGMAELLEKTDQTPTQKKYSDIIISSGNVLLKLINDILDLTKMSENKLILEESPYDLDQLLLDCVASFVPLMYKKNIPLYINLQPGMPLHYIGDQHRMRQLVYNLINNALKFTNEGSVTVNVSIEASQQTGSVSLLIAITDTGAGIEPDFQQAIFKQFTQADAATTRNHGGTGLGLAICHSIVEVMGGSIDLASEVGVGSTFTIELPVLVDEAGDLQAKESLTALANKRLLVVSGSGEHSKSVMSYFDFLSLDIVTVTSADDANKLLGQSLFDAVIVFYPSNAEEITRAIGSMHAPLLIVLQPGLIVDRLLSSATLHSFVDLSPIAAATGNYNEANRVLGIPGPASTQAIGLAICTLFKEDKEIESMPALCELLSDYSHLDVLVAEDNVTNQMVVLGMLKNLGIKADVAKNGQEAVDMCMSKNYSLVFMDCEMPVMDGYEATRIILTESAGHKPIIVAITAQSVDAAGEKCRAAGMKDVLHKPITFNQLNNSISTVMR